uniref:Ig-like domain-containing protein n=1 Tax=Esox lucius TaxID=8010 RepID=A0AAY5K6J4_ESOLU
QTFGHPCIASNPAGADTSTVRLQVVAEPPGILEVKRQQVKAGVGQSIWFSCTAQGNPQPTVYWVLYDGTAVQHLKPSLDPRVSVYTNGTLHLIDIVGMAEEGDYTCYAKNQLGKDEMHVHITVVTAPPRIRMPSRTYASVKPGRNVRFDCEAIGEPKPKILWMLPNNDMIAASNERYLMHVNGSLDIRGVKLVDAGEYVCMARNTAGDDSKVYKLDIDGNPPVINGYYQNRTVVKDTAANRLETHDWFSFGVFLKKSGKSGSCSESIFTEHCMRMEILLEPMG